VQLQDRAVVPGLPGVRTWSDEMTPEFERELLKAIDRETAHWQKSGHKGPIPTTFLAISGGGPNGAYGAGLLNGWTAAGTRPEFTVVTGVSTGALSAPFAFLGSAYDDRLATAFTSVATKDVLKMRGLSGALFNDALADNAPLAKLLGRLIDEDFLQAVATEYEKKGRLLLIGTTNLDAGRGMIWNMGLIAASDHPKKLELFHRILLGSAGIPGLFPPLMMDVEVDGKPYQEMHVDGGINKEAFLYPPSFVAPIHRGKVDRKMRAYVIENGQLDPTWENMQRSTIKIAIRAIQSLLESQSMGNIYEIYLIAQRDGIEFDLAYIPQEFNEKSKEPFDPVYMKKLYDLAYKTAKNGYPWSKTPPDYIEGHAEQSNRQ